VKLFSIPTYVKIIPERHGQTDGQTTYCGITVLCGASRGKKSLLSDCLLVPTRLAFTDLQNTLIGFYYFFLFVFYSFIWLYVLQIS